MSDNGKGKRILPERPPFNAIKQALKAQGADIYVSGPVPPEQLASRQLSAKLHCFRPSCKQLQALIELAGQPDGLVFTASTEDLIIAYATFQKPDYPWWQSRCQPCLLELGSLETDPAWRKGGIASTLMAALFNNADFTYFERYIVMAMQSSANWDLSGTGLEPWAYRKMMVGFFKKYGFQPRETLDPEIAEFPGSVLLVRTGSLVDEAAQCRFTADCNRPGY